MTRVLFEDTSDANIPVTYISLMKKLIKKCVEHHYPNHKFEVALLLCDDNHIRILNKQFRDKNYPTDVLSFPIYEFDTPEKTTLLGDIVISAEVATRQAVEYGHSLKRELCFLAVHGALHLLGYDHKTKEDAKEMEEKQSYFLDLYKITK